MTDEDAGADRTGNEAGPMGARGRPTTIEETLALVEADRLALVRFLWCDTDGVVRGKMSSATGLGDRMASGIGLTRAMQAMSMLDHLQPVEGMGPVGEVRLAPDPTSFVPLPYADRQGALLCDLLTPAGEPWEACPRSFLKRQIGHAAARGLQVQASFEGEFLLARIRADGVPRPVDAAQCFSSTAMNIAGPYLGNLIDALERQGLSFEQYYPELGHGQHEITIRHAPALRAADDAVTLRETVRGVASSLGLHATFAPKPLAQQAGNGAHIHVSAWDAGGTTNLFYDRDAAYGLSPLGRRFVAGVVAHLPGLVALSCPSVNSYRRLQPRAWSSAYNCWGPDNREAAVRVASPFRHDESGTLNAELKPVDGSCNPYLALGGLIAAGLDGIARELDPGEPMLVDPADLSDDERTRRGVARLPSSLGEALAALETDAVLTEALGPLLLSAYLAVKRGDIADFAQQGEDEERLTHARTF